MKVTSCDRCGKICNDTELDKPAQEIQVTRKIPDPTRVSRSKMCKLDFCDECKADLLNWLEAYKDK